MRPQSGTDRRGEAQSFRVLRQAPPLDDVFRAVGLSKNGTANASGTELPVGVFKHAPVRITAGQRHPDLACGKAHLSADTQQL